MGTLPASSSKHPNVTFGSHSKALRLEDQTSPFGAFERQLHDRRSWTTTVAQTKTKMDLVGSGCEKAKHHLNPSPKRLKTLRNQKQKTGETLPTEPSKDKKKIASSTTNLQAAGKTCPKTSWALKNQPARRNTQTSPLDHTMKQITKRHKNSRNATLGARKRPPLRPSKDN